MRLFALFALLLVCPALAAEGPAPLPLSLPEATRRALSLNQDIAIERESLVQADEAVRGTKGAFDPLLGLDAGYRQHTDPVNSLFSGAPAGHLGPTTKSFSFSASLS